MRDADELRYCVEHMTGFHGLCLCCLHEKGLGPQPSEASLTRMRARYWATVRIVVGKIYDERERAQQAPAA